MKVESTAEHQSRADGHSGGRDPNRRDQRPNEAQTNSSGGSPPSDGDSEQATAGGGSDHELSAALRRRRELERDQLTEDSQAETDPSNEPKHANARIQGSADPAQRRALERLLERVPDDPGGLLRRKFALQYRQRNRGQQQVRQQW